MDQVEQPKDLIGADFGGVPSLSRVDHQQPATLVVPALEDVDDVVLEEGHLLVDRHQILEQGRVLALEIGHPLHQLVRALRVEFAWPQEDYEDVVVCLEIDGLVLCK